VSAHHIHYNTYSCTLFVSQGVSTNQQACLIHPSLSIRRLCFTHFAHDETNVKTIGFAGFGEQRSRCAYTVSSCPLARSTRQFIHTKVFQCSPCGNRGGLARPLYFALNIAENQSGLVCKYTDNATRRVAPRQKKNTWTPLSQPFILSTER